MAVQAMNTTNTNLLAAPRWKKFLRWTTLAVLLLVAAFVWRGKTGS